MTSLPTLYKLTSTGEIQEWTVSSEGDVVTTVYGLLTGKKQTATKTATPKNDGRSNATTAEEQAVVEAQQMWDRKRKGHYVLSVEEAQSGDLDTSVIAGGVSPMLAHVWGKHGSKIEWPAAVQPKLDGHRCIAVVNDDGSVTLFSRTQKVITGVPHISAAIEGMNLPNGTILDGELYNHDYRDQFETLTSFIRQQEPKVGCEVVQYHVYDVASMKNYTFSDRNSFIVGNVKDLSPYVIMVETRLAADSEEMMSIQFEYLQDGYEGLMVRNVNSLYKNGRSYDLQKVKEFDDAEFVIVNVEEGVGKMAGKAIFVCATSSGAEFNCKMAGSLDDLADIWNNKSDYIGKVLTVKYQGMTTANGVPRFPVGLRLRQDV